MSISISLFGGLSIPFYCFVQIFGNTFTFFVHTTQTILSFSISLFSWFSIPFRSYGIVSGTTNALTFIIHFTQIILSSSISHFRILRKMLKGSFISPCIIFSIYNIFYPNVNFFLRWHNSCSFFIQLIYYIFVLLITWINYLQTNTIQSFYKGTDITKPVFLKFLHWFTDDAYYRSWYTFCFQILLQKVFRYSKSI